MTAASNGQWDEMLGSVQRTGAGTGGVAREWDSDSLPEICRSQVVRDKTLKRAVKGQLLAGSSHRKLRSG
jgi:hypothetical protein